MPTHFGVVSIKWQLVEDGAALRVSYSSDFRHRPEKVLLHVPPVAGLKSVILNGKRSETKPGEVLRLE